MRESGRPRGVGGRAKKPAWWKPVWGPSGEQPVSVQEFTEGSIFLYGTRRAVVVLRELPITVTMPWSVVGGASRWSLSRSIREGLTMALRKLGATGDRPAASGSGAADVGAWPNLWEYLTATTYPDGADRQTASVILVADLGGWRGCVSDKDNGRTMWKTAATVEGLLLALEEALATDDPSQWRQAGGAFKNRRKRS